MSLNRYEEDPEERAEFEHGVKVLSSGPLVAIAHFLGIAHQFAPPNGSYGKQCAIMANTLLDIAANPVSVRQESMGPHFTKFYLEGLPVPAVLHRFTEAEPNADPHDHPWNFTSFVISGGYEEEVFTAEGHSYYAARRPGDSFDIAAGHIHRITYLFSGGPCWTLVLPGPPERVPGFYRWDENGTPLYRQWNEIEFKHLKS